MYESIIMYQLIQRGLQKNEAKLLVEQIKQTPNITGYSLKEWMNFKNILVAEDRKKQLMGVCLYYDFSKQWTFISVLFILNQFRGNGIGKALFCKACQNIQNNNKNIYTASQNPIVIKMMKNLNFIIFDSLLTLPKPYKKYELIFALRALKWVMNYYRIKEFVRKSIIYKEKNKFVYGIKPCQTYNS